MVLSRNGDEIYGFRGGWSTSLRLIFGFQQAFDGAAQGTPAVHQECCEDQAATGHLQGGHAFAKPGGGEQCYPHRFQYQYHHSVAVYRKALGIGLQQKTPRSGDDCAGQYPYIKHGGRVGQGGRPGLTDGGFSQGNHPTVSNAMAVSGNAGTFCFWMVSPRLLTTVRWLAARVFRVKYSAKMNAAATK